MSQMNPYDVTNVGAAMFAEESERTTFIRRTYAHLSAAVFAFVALETVLFNVVPAQTMQTLVVKMSGGMSWLIVLGAFMGVSWLARAWATSSASRGTQYAGLALYVVAEAIIFLPILYVAIRLGGPQMPLFAGAITAMCFTGLTAFVFVTRIDMAPWGKYLAMAGIAAMAMIAVSILTGGFSLGVLFCGAMVALSCAYILYDTSNVLHHYRTDQYVAASLALFASVAMLFFYILRMVMAFSSRD